MLPDEIDELRREYGLDPDLYSDEAVVQTVEMTKLLAQEYLKLMTNGLDEEIRVKVKKKLLKMGYSEKEIEKYESIRQKVKYGFKLQLHPETQEKMKQISKDYTVVYIEIQKKFIKNKSAN